MKGQLSKERIFMAALAIFAQHGYHGTSMRQIAARAKLSKPALYHHFKNKESLFRQLFGHAFAAFKNELDRVYPRQGNLDQKIARLLRYEFTFSRQHKDMVSLAYSLFMLPAQARLNIDFHKLDQQYFHHIEDLIAEWLGCGKTKPAKVKLAARMIKGLAEQTILTSLYAKEKIDPHKMALTIPRVVLRGMGIDYRHKGKAKHNP